MSARTITREATQESLGAAVVTAVAEAESVDPLALDPLYDAIDSTAAEALFTPPYASVPWTNGVFRFTYAGRPVCVYAAGIVEVWPADQAAGAASGDRPPAGRDRTTAAETSDD